MSFWVGAVIGAGSFNTGMLTAWLLLRHHDGNRADQAWWRGWDDHARASLPPEEK